MAHSSTHNTITQDKQAGKMYTWSYTSETLSRCNSNVDEDHKFLVDVGVCVEVEA